MTNPKDLIGRSKASISLVPSTALIGMAKAFKEGADKYGAYNWRTIDVEALTYCDAIMRHLLAYIDGEDEDPESKSGKHHIDGILASAAILTDARINGTLIDNRPPRGVAGDLLRDPDAKFVVLYGDQAEGLTPEEVANIIRADINEALDRTPNQETIDAMNEDISNFPRFDSVVEFFDDLNDCTDDKTLAEPFDFDEDWFEDEEYKKQYDINSKKSFQNVVTVDFLEENEYKLKYSFPDLSLYEYNDTEVNRAGSQYDVKEMEKIEESIIKGKLND